MISAISSAFTLMFLCTRPTTNTKHKSSLKEIEVDIDLSDSVDDRNKTVRHIDYPPKNERLKVKNENKGNDNKSKGSKFNDTKSNNRDSGKKNLELSKEEKGKNMSCGKNRRKIRRFDQQKNCQSLKPEREGQ